MLLESLDDVGFRSVSSEQGSREGQIRDYVLAFQRAFAARRACARRSSGDTFAQRALAPFLPPSRPQARNRSRAASMAGGCLLRRFLAIQRESNMRAMLQRVLHYSRGCCMISPSWPQREA